MSRVLLVIEPFSDFLHSLEVLFWHRANDDLLAIFCVVEEVLALARKDPNHLLPNTNKNPDVFGQQAASLELQAPGHTCFPGLQPFTWTT